MSLITLIFIGSPPFFKCYQKKSLILRLLMLNCSCFSSIGFFFCCIMKIMNSATQILIKKNEATKMLICVIYCSACPLSTRLQVKCFLFSRKLFCWRTKEKCCSKTDKKSAKNCIGSQKPPVFLHPIAQAHNLLSFRSKPYTCWIGVYRCAFGVCGADFSPTIIYRCTLGV